MSVVKAGEDLSLNEKVRGWVDRSINRAPLPVVCERACHVAPPPPYPPPLHTNHSTPPPQEFILQALRLSDCRADGRTARDTRPLRVTYARGEAQASAEVQLGRTR